MVVVGKIFCNIVCYKQNSSIHLCMQKIGRQYYSIIGRIECATTLRIQFSMCVCVCVCVFSCISSEEHTDGEQEKECQDYLLYTDNDEKLHFFKDNNKYKIQVSMRDFARCIPRKQQSKAFQVTIVKKRLEKFK